jgi:hypothetical protein
MVHLKHTNLEGNKFIHSGKVTQITAPAHTPAKTGDLERKNNRTRLSWQGPLLCVAPLPRPDPQGHQAILTNTAEKQPSTAHTHTIRRWNILVETGTGTGTHTHKHLDIEEPEINFYDRKTLTDRTCNETETRSTDDVHNPGTRSTGKEDTTEDI